MLEPIHYSDPLVECAARYYDVKRRVMQAGHAEEVAWQQSRDLRAVTESDFLSESAWVILCSGFRERTVANVFPAVSKAFLDWESAERICASAETCVSEAADYFGHRQKLDALVTISIAIANTGFASVMSDLVEGGSHYLQRFPFLGPVTSRHLAKNLGIADCKPDRHLLRLASAGGFSSAEEMCETLSLATGETLPVVDVVLWRACERGWFSFS